MRSCEVYRFFCSICSNLHGKDRGPAVLLLRINRVIRPDSKRTAEPIRNSEGAALILLMRTAAARSAAPVLFQMKDFHYEPVKRRIRRGTDFSKPFRMFGSIIQPACQEFPCPYTAESIISGPPVHPIKLIRLLPDDEASVIVHCDGLPVRAENHTVIPLCAGD